MSGYRRSHHRIGLPLLPKVQRYQRVAQKFINPEGADGAIESYELRAHATGKKLFET
jgi:hypothetical protein